MLGTTGGLDLPAMGLNPLRKNILVEFDWMFDNFADACTAGSAQPTAAAIATVAQSFANAPARNEDGSTGFVMISDFGQGGAFTGGNLIADADGVIQGFIEDADYQAQRAANFAPNRLGYFHYGIMAHRFAVPQGNTFTGQAEIIGDEFLVALYCLRTDYNQATTILHELGHNLSLRHGGFDDCGFKPNYSSVMNLRYQFYGIDADCNGLRGPAAGSAIDFSPGNRVALNESGLTEAVGVCGAPGIDWNNNGVATDVGVVRDVHSQESQQPALCGGSITTLQDHNDWGGVLLGGVTPSLSPPFGVGETALCKEAPPGP